MHSYYLWEFCNSIIFFLLKYVWDNLMNHPEKKSTVLFLLQVRLFKCSVFTKQGLTNFAKCSFIGIVKSGSWTVLRNKVFKKATIFYCILVRYLLKTYIKSHLFTCQSDPLLKKNIWFNPLHCPLFAFLVYIWPKISVALM